LSDVLKLGTTDLQAVVLSICEFSEHWNREGRTLRARVKLSLLVHREIIWNFGNKERLAQLVTASF